MLFRSIVIDNWTTQEEPILNVLPESMEYEGRCESGGVKFETGTISILGRSKFKNWSDQRKISIVVPDSLFLDKFDYTNALIKINVTQGSEIECAAKLNKYAYTYRYTFLDHASEYIKEQDDNTTIRSGTYGILIFVTCINLFSILYINILTYMRRRKNLSILKILGYSNMNLIVPILFEMITEGFVATIIAEFTVTVLTKCFVPKYTQDIVLVNGFLDMTYIFIVIVLVQVVSVVMIWFRLMKQKVIHDLRLQ